MVRSIIKEYQFFHFITVLNSPLNHNIGRIIVMKQENNLKYPVKRSSPLNIETASTEL